MAVLGGGHVAVLVGGDACRSYHFIIMDTYAKKYFSLLGASWSLAVFGFEPAR